ncbi:MAG: DUF4149 domain-containing protein [Candidatus Competibacterales bacterium]
MSIESFGYVAAMVLVASVWGSMLFFAAVVAPAVFSFLKPDVAGPFIRRLFPFYYGVLGVASILAAIGLGLRAFDGAFWAILAVALGFVVARQGLMPKINALRDRSLQGDQEAERHFQRYHGASVILNAVQMLVVFAVLVLNLTF